jgi:signal transduction histidine kinase
LRRLRHDLRNQLGIILGFSELFLSDVNPADPRHDDMREISRAARRAIELVDAMTAAEEGQQP